MKNIEIDVNYKGFLIKVIYGFYSDGYYIVIPEWERTCNASDPEDVQFNIEKLISIFTTDCNVLEGEFIKELAKFTAISIELEYMKQLEL